LLATQSGILKENARKLQGQIDIYKKYNDELQKRADEAANEKKQGAKNTNLMCQ
jgi:hypothetical protein